MPKQITAWGANYWKIPEELYAKYHGCGHAIAAIFNDEIVDIKYLRDIHPDFEIDIDEPTQEQEHEFVKGVIVNPLVGETIRYFQSLGEVSVGMCSSYEFVEL